MITPNAAKEAMKGLKPHEKPMLRFHMPADYKAHVKELQAHLGIHKLWDIPHELNAWVTRKMPKSWPKKKREVQLGRLVMVGSAGHVPDVDNAIGCLMDAMFPQQHEYDWASDKKTKMPGTGDDSICRAWIEMRWGVEDTIRVQVKPIEDVPHVWEWLEKTTKAMF